MDLVAVLIVLAGIYIISGILAAGSIYAHFQGKFPTLAERARPSHKQTAWIAFLLGWMGAAGTYLFLRGEWKNGGKNYGWKRWW